LNFILRRKHHEPLSYIIKRKEFWSLGFNVNHNVLIPRPETEIIVEQVIRRFKDKGSLNILDIGTGSGCILLSILKELRNSYGTGIDKESKLLL
ncbi:MAG: peptide chain release factor N(5)-glutamine methyltransferase, partial [Pelagibacteraceae bacterium]|nr:peptide chain release factor N(5)-glutamine methyltransferase [Pelagibacteraceae bacterium]